MGFARVGKLSSARLPKDGALWSWQLSFIDNSTENSVFVSVTDPNKTPPSAVAKSCALNSVCGGHDIILILGLFSKDSYLADGRKGHLLLTGMKVPYELQQEIFSRYGNVRNQFHAYEQLLV